MRTLNNTFDEYSNEYAISEEEKYILESYQNEIPEDSLQWEDIFENFLSPEDAELKQTLYDDFLIAYECLNEEPEDIIAAHDFFVNNPKNIQILTSLVKKLSANTKHESVENTMERLVILFMIVAAKSVTIIPQDTIIFDDFTKFIFKAALDTHKQLATNTNEEITLIRQILYNLLTLCEAPGLK